MTKEITAVTDEPDERLVERVAGRDEAVLATLYDRHIRTALGLAYRITGDQETAEEAVQEAFLSLWRGAGTYRPDRGAVRTWLLTMVRNRSIDVLRAPARQPHIRSVEDLPLAAPDDPLQEAITAASGAAVRAAVATLPPDQRLTVELAYFAGLSYPEIAARMGVPLGTVKSRLRLALERLRGQLLPERAQPPARPRPAARKVRARPVRPPCTAYRPVPQAV